jgi:hypothetical protein
LASDRDQAALTRGLDEVDTAILNATLERITDPTAADPDPDAAAGKDQPS